MNIINQIVNALGGWDAVIKIVAGIIAALLGVPLVSKEPSRLPLIGRFYPTDEDKERRAISVIAAIRTKREVAAKEKALADSLIAATTEPQK